MMKIYKIILLFGLLFCFSNIKAQISDFQTWSTISLVKEFDFDLKLSLSEEFRLYENSTKIDEYFTELGIEYKLNKYFAFGGGYRYITNYTKKGNIKTENRFDAKVVFDFSIDRFSFDYRLKYQTDNENSTNDNVTKPFEHTLRNQLKISYNIKGIKLEPYILSDLYYSINLDDISEFSKLKNSLGLEYELSKKNSFDLFLMTERELNITDFERNLILGLGYKYKFK